MSRHTTNEECAITVGSLKALDSIHGSVSVIIFWLPSAMIEDRLCRRDVNCSQNALVAIRQAQFVKRDLCGFVLYDLMFQTESFQ